MPWHWFIHWFLSFHLASFSISPFRNVDFKLRFCIGVSIWKGVCKFRGASGSNGLYVFLKKETICYLSSLIQEPPGRRGLGYFFADCETKHALLMAQEGRNQQYVVSFSFE